MSISRFFAVRAWGVAVLALGAFGAANAGCRTQDRSEQVAVVLCSAGSDLAALKSAGEAACKGKAVCNAWIWEDAGKLPAQAPAADKDLPKAAAGAARAVWIHDARHLMEVRKATAR